MSVFMVYSRCPVCFYSKLMPFRDHNNKKADLSSKICKGFRMSKCGFLGRAHLR